MHLSFHGAARTVTGSCFRLEVGGRQLLVDCGMFQGAKALRARNRNEFAFAPNKIDAVLLTHAHIDHSGLLPRLVREGFRGRIFTTAATTDLCGVMLPDAAHIQEMETEWRNRKARRLGRKEDDPLYTPADAEATLKLFAPVGYGEEVQVLPGVRARFLDAGHILGSAIIEVWAKDKSGETKIVFSGDLGQRGAPIIRDPSVVEQADYLLIESTYGDRWHDDVKKRREQLAAVIKSAAASGGNLIIPAFAVGRTQELLYEIRGLANDGIIAEPQVFIDSPMAVSATEIFRRHPDCFDKETWRLLAEGESPLDFPGLRLVRSVEESRALNERPGGAIIISASGMCDAGRILHHLRHNLWRPEAHLLFVGYQAEGTLGRRLLDGEKNIRIMGEEIAVRAAIHSIGSFSAHADRDGLLEWLGNFQSKPRTLFLVHGEDDVLDNWAADIKQELNITPFIPFYGETYDLNHAARSQGREVAATASDDWAELLKDFDAAYRGLRLRLPAEVPGDQRAARRLRALLRRMAKDMAKVG